MKDAAGTKGSEDLSSVRNGSYFAVTQLGGGPIVGTFIIGPALAGFQLWLCIVVRVAQVFLVPVQELVHFCILHAQILEIDRVLRSGRFLSIWFVEELLSCRDRLEEKTSH